MPTRFSSSICERGMNYNDGKYYRGIGGLGKHIDIEDTEHVGKESRN